MPTKAAVRKKNSETPGESVAARPESGITPTLLIYLHILILPFLQGAQDGVRGFPPPFALQQPCKVDKTEKERERDWPKCG